MLHTSHTFILGLFGTEIGWSELLIAAIIGVIVFGKRLPEVGRSVGKSIVEFKKGLKGIEEELHSASDESSSPDSSTNDSGDLQNQMQSGELESKASSTETIKTNKNSASVVESNSISDADKDNPRPNHSTA